MSQQGHTTIIRMRGGHVTSHAEDTSGGGREAGADDTGRDTQRQRTLLPTWTALPSPWGTTTTTTTERRDTVTATGGEYASTVLVEGHGGLVVFFG